MLPAFELADFKGLKIERPVAEVTDEEVEARLTQLGESARATTMPSSGRPADGDRVGFSYLGKIDGEPFEGGTDEDAKLVLGSGQFIPGFEDAAPRR